MTKNNIFPTILLLMFIWLKLTHVIEWSWLWVLAPFWIPCVIALSVLLFGLLMALLSASGGSRGR